MTAELAPTEQSLWAIVDTLQALFDTIEGLDPGASDYAACKADLEQQLERCIRKVTGIHHFRAHALAMVERCNIMQATYLSHRISWEHTVARLEKYVKSVMEHAGKKELEGDGLKIKIKNNPPSVLILDETMIPAAYKKLVTPEPYDQLIKAEIAKAIKSGVDVPGADLNISSTRLDWGDPPKKKTPKVDWEHLPQAKGEIE